MILQLVAVIDLVVEGEAIAEAAAAAALDEEAEVRIGLALAGSQLEHLLRGGFGDRHEQPASRRTADHRDWLARSLGHRHCVSVS